MLKLKEMAPEKRTFIIAMFVYGFGIVVFIPFIFINSLYFLLTGWLLGMIINIINYALIIKQSHMLKHIANGKSRYAILLPLLYILRFGLYIIGLLLVGILHRYGFDYFNIFTTFAAYLVIAATIFFTETLPSKSKGKLS